MARDWAHEETFEDAWIVTLNAPRKAKPASFGPGSGILLVAAALVLVLFLNSDRVGSAPVAAPNYLPPVTSFADKLQRMMPGAGKLSLRDDFSADLRNWQGPTSGAGDSWARVKDAVRIGDLRLWKPTLTLTDYQLNFEAEIDRKALGWAFRATDPKHYYATKINLLQRGQSLGGSSTRAEIERYVVVDGRKLDKVELPIPIIVDSNTVYDVQVRVKGNLFSTVVNGRLVDTWNDKRLAKGGVGFFSEAGEIATVRWVSLSERESFLDRFLSFSLFVAPSRLGY